MIKAGTVQKFCEELACYERSGCAEVRKICGEALEKWGSDHESLAELSALYLEAAGRAHECANDDLLGTYLLLLNEISDYARLHLDPDSFHRFCEDSNYLSF